MADTALLFSVAQKMTQRARVELRASVEYFMLVTLFLGARKNVFSYFMMLASGLHAVPKENQMRRDKFIVLKS